MALIYLKQTGVILSKVSSEYQFNLIISDIGMPSEDGYEFTRRIRSMSSNFHSKTPAIALTAYAQASDQALAIQSGFQCHLTKPIEPAELLRTIEDLFVTRKAA